MNKYTIEKYTTKDEIDKFIIGKNQDGKPFIFSSFGWCEKDSVENSLADVVKQIIKEKNISITINYEWKKVSVKQFSQIASEEKKYHKTHHFNFRDNTGNGYGYHYFPEAL